MLVVMCLRSTDANNSGYSSFLFTLLYSIVWKCHNLFIMLMVNICFLPRFFLWECCHKRYFTYFLAHVFENFSKICLVVELLGCKLLCVFNFTLACLMPMYFPKWLYQFMSHQQQTWAPVPLSPQQHLALSEFLIWFIFSILLQTFFLSVLSSTPFCSY